LDLNKAFDAVEVLSVESNIDFYFILQMEV